MSSLPDNVLDVATSVSDGALFDWNALGTSAKLAEDPALLRELEVIARIADVHRSAARDGRETRSVEERRWGRLVIKEEMGAGSFGTVYRAHDSGLERDVALKIYKTGAQAISQLSSLFAEGRLLARVRHQNVVVVHGVEQQGDEVGLWLELIDGRTLADEVRSAGPLGIREAVLIGQDVCRALAAVHQAGLIHRDVKPQNVMRERGGRIVLMDFGIGRDLLASPSEGDPGGTPLYMAPELFEGGASSTASDIYSVGVLLFYLVTGSYPIVATTRVELERSHQEGRRRLLRDVRPDAPDAFVDVIERACAVDPRLRYRTVGAMQSALSGVIGLPSGASVTPDRPSEPARHRTKPIRFALAAALIVSLAVSAMAVILHRFPSWSQPARSTTSVDARPDTSPSAPVNPDQYQIRAGFRRVSDTGADVLAAGAHVAPGDRLFLEVTATKAVHVYIVNQDDRGESYLLFPLPGQAVSNPLSAGTLHRLPGGGVTDEVYWQVTSAGGREHFLVVASPEPLDSLEAVFARLPKPEPGRAVTAAPLSTEIVGQLRGIGGLTSQRPARGPASDLLRSAVTLGSELETVKGPWIRQFTLENPGR